MKFLLIHEIGHTATYLLMVIALAHLLKYKKLPLKEILIGYTVTILMDSDHLVDYLLYKKWLYFNLHEFFSSNYFEVNGTIYVLLHAWEWVAILLGIFVLTKKRHLIILFIAVAIAAHMVFDTVSYGFDSKVYFITYRAINDFASSIFYSIY